MHVNLNSGKPVLQICSNLMSENTWLPYIITNDTEVVPDATFRVRIQEFSPVSMQVLSTYTGRISDRSRKKYKSGFSIFP